MSCRYSFLGSAGITAASSCSAYSGIPLTHRDYAGVRLVTGRENRRQLDWENGGRKRTLVFYIRAESGSDYREKLIAFGMQADMPADLPGKRYLCEATSSWCMTQLGELAQQVESPALIIVGRVVGLRDKLNWFSNY